MGQYYKIYTKKNKTEKVYKIDGYCKLMEHSYFENYTVNFILKKLITLEGMNVAWVGDYYNDTEYFDEDIYCKVWGNGLEKNYTPDENSLFSKEYRYLYNKTKNEYVDLSKMENHILGDQFGCIIHPLPLLTCASNGLGGGDYYGINQNEVGSWAFDFIQLLKIKPEDASEKEVYFVENINYLLKKIIK